MLVSHDHRFVFLKTMKTAGTSVEISFEHVCLPPGTPSVERREEVVSALGIVGARPRREDSNWWNHMPASLLRSRLGDDIWNSYFRFSCVRDPFEATVSMFWWNHRERLSEMAGRPFGERRTAFHEWVRDGAALPTNDRILFEDDGSLAVHDVIRYEHLANDVARICQRVGMTFEPERLQSFKGAIRPKDHAAKEYYDTVTADVVSERFARYRGHFGYDLDWRP